VNRRLREQHCGIGAQVLSFYFGLFPKVESVRWIENEMGDTLVVSEVLFLGAVESLLLRLAPGDDRY
jgi:hypothetical protein